MLKHLVARALFRAQPVALIPRESRFTDRASYAKYRHHMITSSAKEIRAHNRALVEKRIEEGRVGTRRLGQLQRGL